MVRGKEEEAGYLIFMAALARGGGGGGCVVICSAGSGDFPERWVKKTEKLSRRSSIDLLQYLHCEEGKKQFKHQLLGTYWWKEKQKEPSFHFFPFPLLQDWWGWGERRRRRRRGLNFQLRSSSSSSVFSMEGETFYLTYSCKRGPASLLRASTPPSIPAVYAMPLLWIAHRPNGTKQIK